MDQIDDTEMSPWQEAGRAMVYIIHCVLQGHKSTDLWAQHCGTSPWASEALHVVSN